MIFIANAHLGGMDYALTQAPIEGTGLDVELHSMIRFYIEGTVSWKDDWFIWLIDELKGNNKVLDHSMPPEQLFCT